MAETGYLPKWQAVADEILSVMLKYPERWIDVIAAGVDASDLPPGNWQPVFNTAVRMASDQATPAALSGALVATEAGGSVDTGWVLERMAIVDQMALSNFDGHLSAARAFGRIHRTLDVLRRGAVSLNQAANNGLKYEEPMQRIMRDLQGEQMVKTGVTVGLTDLMAQNRDVMNADPMPRAETGLWLLDKLITGMKPTEFVAQVAPYKMRKTSLAANMIIHRLRQGDQINIFSLDEPRDEFIYRLESLLMAEYMWQQGHHDDPINVIDVKALILVGKRWRKWPQILQDAFQYAWDSLSTFGPQCRIYDMETCTPGTDHIGALCRIDAQKHGGLDMIFLDHLQSLTDRKKIFEKVEEGAADLHALRGELRCRLWLLAQQNEEAIKSSMTEHSPQVKGGGGLASKADTVIMSKYNHGAIEGHPQIVRIDLNNARHDAARKYGYMEIHPPSGWITPRGKDKKNLHMSDFLAELKSLHSENLNDLLNEKIGYPQ